MNFKRLLSLVVCAAMLLSLMPAGILSISAASPLDVTTRYGRTYVENNTLYLFWVNSGFSFRINGTGATATLTASSTAEIYRGYLNVYVDGEFAPSKTICLEQETGTYTLAEGLPAGEHTIEVRKRNEGGYDGTAIIGVQAINAIGGNFLEPPAAPTRQIEFIGDSITTGFGNLGNPDDEYSTAISDGTMSYSVLTAKQLGVEAQVVSRSGIHYGHSRLTKPKNENADPSLDESYYVDSFYDHYAYTATLPGRVGSAEPWDFNADPSDVVVINLGTNDAGADRDDATRTSDAVDFINLVRSKNPNAIIIWTYGMMGNGVQAYIEAAVAQVKAAGDNKVFFLPLENLNQATEGIAAGHPTVQTDINRSRVLAEFIAEKTGWTVNNKAMLQAQLQWSAQYNTDDYLNNYTAISKKNFTDAYTAGEALLNDATATNADYVAAAEAIWMSKVNLLAASDVSNEYIVIDPCETTNDVGFGDGTGSFDSDDFKEGTGALAVHGDHGLLCINNGNYNIELPEDWENWYFEAWLYVSDPSAIGGDNSLEIAENADNIEVAWRLASLNLQAGWNKIQLKMSSAEGKTAIDQFKTLRSIRVFMTEAQEELTVKLDNMVLAKGKAAANIAAWETALKQAETILARTEDAKLRTAYEVAKTAISQADVDAFTKRLNDAMATLGAAVTIIFDNPIYTSGDIELSPAGQGDSKWTLTTAGGYPVLNLDDYAYFKITNQDVLNADGLTMEVTYYDNTTSNLNVQYVGTYTGKDEDNYRGVNIERYASGELVTTTIALPDADFDRATQNTGARFRISGGGNIRSITIRLGVTDDTKQAPPAFAPQTTSNDLIGKGVAGYQAWFRAGDQDNEWGHWGGNGSANPAPNQLSFEIYPDVKDYLENGATLYPSKLGDLGNGEDSLLFNSTDDAIIETHFQWMKEYDLDGAAVQRFYANTSTAKTTAKNHLETIKEKAEKYDRLFYVMYDFSGCGSHVQATFLRTVQLDFIYNVENKGVASSSAYAHADGKPVVCFWGIAAESEYGYVYGDTAVKLIQWFQERGYYVILGTPDNEYKYRDYTNQEDLIKPFTMADMISPWTVGRYGMAEYEGWLNGHVQADLDFCNKYGAEYQPVVFAGFGWTNMGNNGGINAFPHYAGQFLWAQAYKLKSMGASNIYFAMFDEYDEGTAHMKGATDYFEIPTDQYFLTYAADGWWLSNDFYLRAAGAVIDMMQGKTATRPNIDIPHSQGPVYWRNSFESRTTTYYDNGVQKTGVGKLDVCLNNPAVLSTSAVALSGNAIVTNRAKSGQSSFRLNGNSSGNGTAFYKIADTVINTNESLKLTYSLYAANDNGRDVFVDLLFGDGSRLSNVNASVTETHGAVGEWSEVTVEVGRAAAGKTITGIIVGYEGGNGNFDAYVDDIFLEVSENSDDTDEYPVADTMKEVMEGTAFVDYADMNYSKMDSFQFGDDPASGTIVNAGGTTMAKFNGYLYLNVDEKYVGANDSDVTIKITYLDDVAGSIIKLQYNSNDPNATSSRDYTDYTISCEGSGELRTEVIVLNNASFRNAQNGGCDLRLTRDNDVCFYVTRVEIINNSKWETTYLVDYGVEWTVSNATLFADALAADYAAPVENLEGKFGTLTVGETTTTYTPNALMNGVDTFTFKFGEKTQTLTLMPASSVYYEAGDLLDFKNVVKRGEWTQLTTSEYLKDVIANANAVAKDLFATQAQVNAATSSLAALTGEGNTRFEKVAKADYRGKAAEFSGLRQTHTAASVATVEADGLYAQMLSTSDYAMGYTVDANVIPDTTREVTVFVECKLVGGNGNDRVMIRYGGVENEEFAEKETNWQYVVGHNLNDPGTGYVFDEWNILTFTISDAYFRHNGDNGGTYSSDIVLAYWKGDGNDTNAHMYVRRVAIVPTEQVNTDIPTQAYFDFVNKVETNPYIDGYGSDYAQNGMSYNFNNGEGEGTIEENGLTVTKAMVYFSLSDPSVFGSDVQIKVYTEGENANVDMQYNSSDETLEANIARKYKGGAPKTDADNLVTFTLTDAAFANAQNAGGSFRIYPNGAVITRVEVVKKDSADKTALAEAIEAAEKMDAASVHLTMGDPSDKYGQGGNDALENNNAFGFGDILKGVGSAEGTTLKVPFTGTGIDLYAMIDGTAGEIRVLLKDGTGKLIAARYIDAGFDRGTLYQTPVAQFKDLAYGDYTVELYVYPVDNKFTGDRCTLYLDGVRVYQPLGDVSYGDEGNVQFVSLRDILLQESDLTDNVISTGVAFVANDEYKEYGPKAEVYLAAGQSLTFHVNGNYTGIQIGLHAANGVASTVRVNGATLAVNSTMDMYYKVEKAANNVYVITNTGTSATLVSLTKLKLTGVTGTVSLDVTEQALSAATAQVEQWQTEKRETQNAAEAARQQLIQLLENKVSAYV